MESTTFFVAGAAADIPRQPVRDFLSCGIWILIKDGLGLHHDARCAEAALDAAFEHKGIGESIFFSGRKPFQCGHLLVGHILHLHPATQPGDLVHQDGAAATDPLARTAILGADDARDLAQVGQQAQVWISGVGFGLAVEHEFHGPGSKKRKWFLKLKPSGSNQRFEILQLSGAVHPPPHCVRRAGASILELSTRVSKILLPQIIF
ncbi:MAG: hypothetical protein IPP78_05820 [Holophagaceae bacterium]|nr:hypothetical protein [Holophagaceae bacterium]